MINGGYTNNNINQNDVLFMDADARCLGEGLGPRLDASTSTVNSQPADRGSELTKSCLLTLSFMGGPLS